MWSTPFSLLKRTFMTIFCKPRTLHIAMGRRSHMVDGSSYFGIQTTLVLFKEGGSPTSSQAKHWCYYRWKVSYKYPLYIRPTFEMNNKNEMESYFYCVFFKKIHKGNWISLCILKKNAQHNVLWKKNNSLIVPNISIWIR